MKGILYILCAYLIGEGLSLMIGRLIPGSVLGMVVLLAALQTKTIKAGDVEAPARWLLDNMLLFFVPISVGLMVSWDLIAGHAWATVTVIVTTTLLVMALVGWMQQKSKGGKRG